jgi:hypothetical protein
MSEETNHSDGDKPAVPSNQLLGEAMLIMDKIYGVWMSDMTGNDFIDALDPVIHEMKEFLNKHVPPLELDTHNTSEQGGTRSMTSDGSVEDSDSSE